MELAEELLLLSAQPLSATRVLAMVDDPDASTAELARLVETDPVLSAQVMRLANSAYYGVAGTVGSAGRAVVLLGFTTVRALAVTAVCSLLRHPGSTFAAGFWPHAVATALGAKAVARRTGVPAGDAFSAGLLHDIGAALLRRRDPVAYQHLLRRAGGDRARLVELERIEFGYGHPEASAEVLAAWGMPAGLARAAATHHLPIRAVGTSLGRVVVCGEAIAQRLDDTQATQALVDLDDALAVVGLRGRGRDVLDEVRADAEGLARFLALAA